MPNHRRHHSTEFKRKVVANDYAGKTLHAPGRRHDLSRNLIRIRAEKAEAGVPDEDAAAAGSRTTCDAPIAAFERPVGRRVGEIELPQRRLRARDLRGRT